MIKHTQKFVQLGICLLVLPVCAVAQTDRFAKLPLLETDRPVRTYQTARPAWQTQVNGLLRQSRLYTSPFPDANLPPVQASVLTARDQQIYLSRLIHVQQAVRQNPTLRSFTFVAPQAGDLVRLFPEKLETLENFLQEKPGVPMEYEHNRPFTLAVRLGQANYALEIWIDIPTRKIYLMSDNFYTTSAGKYGLHLR